MFPIKSHMGLGVCLYQGPLLVHISEDGLGNTYFLSVWFIKSGSYQSRVKSDSSEAVWDSHLQAARVLMPSYFLPRSHFLKLARMVSLADSSPQPGAYHSPAPCFLPEASRILMEPRIETWSQVVEINHLTFWLFQKRCILLYLPSPFQYWFSL